MIKIKSIPLFVGAVFSSYAIDSWADSPKGNLLDTLPQVNIQPNNSPKINIEKPSKDINISPSNVPENHVFIHEFKIQGVKSVPFNNVVEIVQPFTNQLLSIEDLQKISQKVTKLYQDNGYVLSFAYFPQQDLTKGIAQLVVVEGYVEHIKISGDTHFNEDRVRHILEPLTLDKPLQKSTFDKINNILSLQPGIQVALNIPPPNTAGGGTTVDAVIHQKKVNFSVGLEAGNPSFQGIISGTINSLTPLGDQLTLSTLQPPGEKHTQYYGLNYAIPLGYQGLIGRFSASSYTEHPNQDILTQLGYQSRYKNENQKLALSLSYPLILHNDKTWFIGGGFYINKEGQTYTPIRNDIFPELNISTRLSVAYLETSFNQMSEKQSRQLGISFYKGMNILGASHNNNLNDTEFFKIKLNATQTFNFTQNTQFKLSGIYQYSPNNLANSEKISFGGTNFGAAYEPGEIAGDKGWGFLTELNYSFKLNNNYVSIIQPFASIDYAHAINNIGISSNAISSTTLGVRLSHQPHYSLGLSVSKPIAHRSIDGHALRYYLSYSYLFN